MIDITLALVIVFDFAISLWNAYGSGYNIGLISRTGSGSWLRAVAHAGLGLAYVGMAYVISVVISIGASYLGYVSANVTATVLAFAFLVFGVLIIGFGAMVMMESVLIAVRRRSIGSVLLALWNSFAEIWDIAVYLESFGDAVSILRGERSEDEQASVVIIIVVALLIAFFVTHAAYKHGQKKAMHTSAGGNL